MSTSSHFIAMSDKKEQEKPLAPAACRHIDIEKSNPSSGEFLPSRHRKCIIVCGCFAAILLIIAMVILVLMFTVLHVKNPVLNMNSVYIEGLNNSTIFGPGSNVTVEADVSVKNPNVASFKFINATTNLYYNDSIVGETTSLSGQARARSTLRMKVSIDVMGDKMFGVGGVRSIFGEILLISLDMRISGKVKITNVIKKSVVLRLNCTMEVNISSHQIQDWNCRRERL